MNWTDLPVLAGIASTAIFAGSTLPMLGKAFRTRDLGSYSLGNLVLANAGNGVHAIYVFSLPAGPLWLLHTFNLLTSGAMLLWFVRYELLPQRGLRDLLDVDLDPNDPTWAWSDEDAAEIRAGARQAVG